MSAHPTVKLKCELTGKSYNIDKKIAPLVLNLWAWCIETTGSCQGGLGGFCVPEGFFEPASVSFKYFDDVEFIFSKLKDHRLGLILSQDRTKEGWTIHFDASKIKTVTKIIGKPLYGGNHI